MSEGGVMTKIDGLRAWLVATIGGKLPEGETSYIEKLSDEQVLDKVLEHLKTERMNLLLSQSKVNLGLAAENMKKTVEDLAVTLHRATGLLARIEEATK